MLKRTLTLALGVTALATGLAACGGSGGSSSGNRPTVKLMVGGIDKQIYLPFQLAQDLGYFKKYGVNVELSTEQNGGVGAEEAMASGQVDMAGAWYVHTIDFQAKHKDVVDIVQLSGAPGERIMCSKGSGVNSPAQWRGKTVGVTDIGSGTDNLTMYLAARNHLTTKDFSRAAVGAGPTFVAALQHNRIVCGMTSQPTAGALQNNGSGYSAIDLATAAGTKRWLGGLYPAASVLARGEWVASHKATVQKVVTALVATMHWINTHTAAQIADKMPPGFVSNGLTTKQLYTQELAQDKGQFLPDGMMPSSAPAVAMSVDKLAGNDTSGVDLAKTYTNEFAAAANKQLGY
jgi:NitT/TauT family transport system substrate-binding protein